MTPSPDEAPPRFSRVKIRAGAVVFCGDEVPLVRRDRPHGTHYTPPGGNVEAGEDLLAALRRELKEELELTVDHTGHPELLWVIDQMVSRPGITPPPRKLHLIYRLHITPDVRANLATEEHDEVPGGHEVGIIEWVNYRKTVGLPLFPPIGRALAALPSPHALVADAALPPVTDANYTWV
jgi:8-oxo-dGTP diphosphatase